MNIKSKILSALAITALTCFTYGCGGGGSATTSSPPSGKLVQGPVSGATVFADRVVGGTKFVLDADEVRVTTDVNGRYVLPSTPSYNYVLVSKGGTDTLSGQPAIQLLAQPGSANITVLTTLVTLDTTNTLYKKIQAMQPVTAPIDFDVSTSSTPATLLMMKSVEIAVQSITSAITSKTSGTISDAQLADIQMQAMQQIALAFAGTTESLITQTGLKNALTAGVGNAITEINKAANIDVQASAAADISNNAVTTAQSLNPILADSTLSISAAVPEANLASRLFFETTISSALSASNPLWQNLLTSTTSASTPFPYVRPDIVINLINRIDGVITGTTGGTGGTGGGTGVGA